MRSISAPALAVLSGPVAPIALLVEMAFASPVRLASGSVTIDKGGQLFFGAGNLGAVEAITDSLSGLQGLRFTLSAVRSENIALALQENVRGTPCTVYVVLLDPANWTVLDTPLVWTGKLDQMPISWGAETSSIAVTAIHRGELFRRPKPLRQTDNDQQRLVPGDTSRRYVVSQSQKRDVWPAASWGRK